MTDSTEQPAGKGRTMHPNSLATLERYADKRFQPGQSGNPGGKTREQRRLEVENAERATRMRNNLLIAFEEEMMAAVDEYGGVETDKIVKMTTTQLLTLLRDSEERGLGKPVQPIEGGETPKTDEEIKKEAAALLRQGGADTATIAALLGDDAAFDDD